MGNPAGVGVAKAGVATAGMAMEVAMVAEEPGVAGRAAVAKAEARVGNSMSMK